MQFRYTFRKMKSSPVVSEYASKKLLDKISKFTTKPTDVHVTFEVRNKNRTVSCHVHGGDGFTLQVDHSAPDMLSAVDQVVDKLEIQLKRTKEKLKNHKFKTKLNGLELVAPPQEKSSDPYDDSIDAGDVIKFERVRKKLLRA